MLCAASISAQSTARPAPTPRLTPSCRRVQGSTPTARARRRRSQRSQCNTSKGSRRRAQPRSSSIAATRLRTRRPCSVVPRSTLRRVGSTWVASCSPISSSRSSRTAPTTSWRRRSERRTRARPRRSPCGAREGGRTGRVRARGGGSARARARADGRGGGRKGAEAPVALGTVSLRADPVDGDACAYAVSRVRCARMRVACVRACDALCAA